MPLYYDDGQFDILAALEDHLLELKKRQQQINGLIATVEKTIAAMKGECEMQDEEKFAAFKQNLVQQHEALYGAELRQNYGVMKWMLPSASCCK